MPHAAVTAATSAHGDPAAHGEPAAHGDPAARGELAAPDLMASGCAFRDRCPYALPVCETSEPPLLEVAPGHWAACHRSQETLNPLSFPI
jgi:oligopeptide/dipeptide ABC transporter ATP-binding protein